MANTYPEPYRSARKDSLIDPSTCYNRECVSYTAWKVRETTGRWPKRTGDMNAKNWVYRLPENGYKKVSAPKAGGKYIGVLPRGTYGHVVWFESGSTVSEYNWNTIGGYGTRSINIKDYIWFEIKAPSTPKPTPKPPTGRVAKKGSATVVVPILNVRSTYSTSGKVVAQYKKGGKFNYDSYIIANGYVWLSYISYSGQRRYVAERSTASSSRYVTGGSGK